MKNEYVGAVGAVFITVIACLVGMFIGAAMETRGDHCQCSDCSCCEACK